MSGHYIHHGVMFSYYSAKSRAYLSYKRLPFVERYHGPDLASRIAEVTHKVMIPVVETPEGEILQDTTVIIDELEARYPQRSVVPEDKVLLLITRIVEFIIDELWISTAMNTRWNDPVSKAFVIREFGNGIGRSFGLEGEKALGVGEQVAGRMQSFLPYLGVGSEAGQAAATAYFESASRHLESAISEQPYVFGQRPSLIDMCLFTGYFAHQYRDPGRAQNFLKGECPLLCYFLDTLHAGQCAPDEGDLVLSDSLRAYLAVLAPAGAAYASGVVAGTEQGAAGSERGVEFNHLIEPFDFDLAGHPFSRGGSSFSAWKLQRAMDVYRGLDDSDRERADVLVDEFGWLEVMNSKPGYRLDRQDHQIVLVG